MIKKKVFLLLFALYLVQYFTAVEWVFLKDLQSNSLYRNWSGFAIFVLILYQWLLTVYRGVYDVKGEALQKKITIHEWIGSVLPLFFYFHSVQPTYGLLFFLSVIFFLNLLWGFLYSKKLTTKHLPYFRIWLIAHVLFSVTVLVLTLLHIWLVFYYN